MNIICFIFSDSNDLSNIFVLFRISHNWIAAIGLLITVTLGLIISFLDTSKPAPVARELLSPVIYPFLSKQVPQNTGLVKYFDVQEALQTLDDLDDSKVTGKRTQRMN